MIGVPKGRGEIKLRARVTARNADGSIVRVRRRYLPFLWKDADWQGPDISVKALLQLTMANIFNQANGVTGNITDSGGTGRSVGANSASTVLMIVAGTSGTAPAFADNALGAIASGGSYGGANSSGNQAATCTAPSSNTFTCTATITNISGSSITYKEIGIAVTVGGNTFLICHDTVNAGAGFAVSNNGTLLVTYTGTFT